MSSSLRLLGASFYCVFLRLVQFDKEILSFWISALGCVCFVSLGILSAGPLFWFLLVSHLFSGSCVTVISMRFVVITTCHEGYGIVL